MCGIYGRVGRDDAGLRSSLAAMSATLVHRGPDGDGAAILDGAALGCRRLAIIDVAGGAQPLTNETGDVVVVCNGEIYNHTVLRRELAARGHRFRTSSDAEVVPHLYEERGPAFVDALDGMFAVAIWDVRHRRLVLVRDRMGEKPLFYALTPGGFFFASEPKALLASGQVSRAPCWDALASYLRTGWTPPTESAFAEIAKLPPGGRLVLEGEDLQVDRYWQVAPLLAEPALDVGLDEAARAVRERLEHAVDAALMADVPVGVFLSGGLDSTAITALACRRRPVATFALGFDAPGFDERAPAAQVAHDLGTRHHTLAISPSLFLEGVRDLAPLMDEPLADAALVPTFLLARFARTEVKVVLTGEGGDELFAGYPTYVGGALAARWRRLPAVVRRMLVAAAPALGASRGNTTVRYLVRRFLESADAPPAARHRAWTGCLTAESLAAVATPGGPLHPSSDPEALPARTEIDALLAQDLTGYLPDDLLPKLDRATMAASLEGRAPFLDHHLVELACHLPIESKLRGLATKRVLRRAVADVVPPAILRRVKRGLTVPLAEWLAGPLRLFAVEKLDSLDPTVFRRDAVRALLDEHVAGRRDNRKELWSLIMLQLWRESGAGG
jgi:asparagine synthase (glutamine-hydrolysing)